MTTPEIRWERVPCVLQELEHARLVAVLNHAGVETRTATLSLGAGSQGGRHAYELFVNADHARQAATVLCDYWDMTDPALDGPMTGPCPACGQEVGELTSCPSCGLAFRSPWDVDDPLIVFLRGYGGFDERE